MSGIAGHDILAGVSGMVRAEIIPMNLIRIMPA
jgi:hypothetical protein